MPKIPELKASVMQLKLAPNTYSYRLAWIAVGALLLLLVATLCGFVAVCGGNAPLCRSENERFYIEPEILAAVEPHLAEWATLDPVITEDERQQIGQAHGVSIDIGQQYTVNGELVTVVHISIEHWYEWTRGMIYVPDNVQLRTSDEFQLKQLEDHIYVFNSNY